MEKSQTEKTNDKIVNETLDRVKDLVLIYIPPRARDNILNKMSDKTDEYSFIKPQKDGFFYFDINVFISANKLEGVEKIESVCEKISNWVKSNISNELEHSMLANKRIIVFYLKSKEVLSK